MVADERAMAAIYDRHHRGLLSFCRHMLGSREEAEEAVRETFQLARPALERSEEPVEVRPWLYAIARNRCIAMLRAGAAPPHEEALHDLARLPVDERAALLLAEDGELNPDEIARVLGVPDDRAEAMVVRARDSLIAPRRPLTDACSAVRVELARPGEGPMPRSHVRRHLRDCPRCRGYRESVRRQHAALTAPVVPSAGLRAAAVGADAPGERRPRHVPLPSPRLALVAGLAVVAVLAVVAGVTALSSGTSTPPAKPPAASANAQKPKPKPAAVAAAPAAADAKPKATHRRRHRRHHHKAKASDTSVASAAPAPQPAPAPPPPVVTQKPKKLKTRKQSAPKQQRPVQQTPKVTQQPDVTKQPKVQKTPQPVPPSNTAGGTAAPPPESGGHQGGGRSVDD